MSVSFDKIKPGLELLDIHSRRIGNTRMRRLVCWRVRVISVDVEARTAMCIWGNNKPTMYTERNFKKLHLKPTKAYLAQQERVAKGSLR